MITELTTLQTEDQQTAVIRLTIPRGQIQEVMGPAIGEVVEAAMSQGIGPVGPVFSNHFRVDPEIFDFEVGVSVSMPAKPVGRVQPGVLPGAKVLRGIYTGPYEGLPQAWAEFMEKMEEGGYEGKPGAWERYLTGPHSNPDAATWQTELNVALQE